MATPFSRTTRALDADHAGVFWTVSLGAITLLVLWGLWFFASEVDVSEVSRQARIEVGASAHAVSPALSGTVLHNHLVLGQSVQAGDVLMTLEASAENLRLSEAQAQWEAIAPRIHSLNREIEALARAGDEDLRTARAATQGAEARAREARTAAEQAKAQAWRITEQGRSGFVSDAATQRAQAESQRLAAGQDAAVAERQRVEREAATRAHQNTARLEAMQREVLTLQGERRTLEATMARLRKDLSLRTVRAPVSGVVGDMAVLPEGSYVAEGKPVATIVPPGQLRVVAWFTPSTALGRIHPGQHARMRLDGFAWTQFGDTEAVVQRVGTELHEGLLRVELQPVGPRAPQLPLQHGLPGTVDVAIEQASPAMLLWRTFGQWRAAGARP